MGQITSSNQKESPQKKHLVSLEGHKINKKMSGGQGKPWEGVRKVLLGNRKYGIAVIDQINFYERWQARGALRSISGAKDVGSRKSNQRKDD